MPAKKEKSGASRRVEPVAGSIADNPIETLTREGSATFEFLRASVKPYFWFLLKADALATILSIAMLVAGGIALLAIIGAMGIPRMASLGFGGAIPTSVLIGIAVASLLVGFVFLVAAEAVKAATFVGTNEGMERGKLPSVLSASRQNLMPALKYMLFSLLLLILLGLPLLALTLRSTAGLLVFIVLMILALLVLIAVFFLTQFAFWEMVINRRGLRESLKASFLQVRKNPVAVLLFDIAIVIIAMAIGSVFSMVSYAIQIMFTVLAIALPVGAILIGGILMVTVMVLESAAISTVALPFTYRFWRSLQRGDSGERG